MDCTTTSELKLLGTWSSSYTLRVQLALKLKGLPFDYAEENLSNKSPSLLLHNPVYKKVPVLLHCGRPLAESTVILHYLDEIWPHIHPLLPLDPYERAVARFWCHFVDDKALDILDILQLGPSVGEVFRLAGEEQAAAVATVHENLKLVEAELRDGYFKGRKFFGGDTIGLLDIVLGCGSYWLSVFEEVTAMKIVDPEALPLFSAWLREFEGLDEVKETVPPLDRLLEYARFLRQVLLGFAAPPPAVDSATCGDPTDSGSGPAPAAATAAADGAGET